jgi:hypothetical protein
MKITINQETGYHTVRTKNQETGNDHLKKKNQEIGNDLVRTKTRFVRGCPRFNNLIDNLLQQWKTILREQTHVDCLTQELG